MPSVQANGMTIEYDVRGEGEPMLFIMGLGGQLVDWSDEFVDLFVDEGYQAIRFDNRDVGLSTQTDWTPPGRMKTLRAMITRRQLKDVGYTVTDMAGDAAGLLDALGISSAHVVGASMGGMIAQELAIEHPSKVRSLCSIMSNTGDRKHGLIAGSLIRKLARMDEPTRENAVEAGIEMFSLFAGPHFDPERYRDVAQADVDRAWTPAGVARQTAAIAGSRNRSPLLEHVTAPTLVIHGLVDTLVKPNGGVETARAIHGSRLLAFGDMGHDLPEPRWPEIRDAIIANTHRAAVRPGADTEPTADVVVG